MGTKEKKSAAKTDFDRRDLEVVMPGGCYIDYGQFHLATHKKGLRPRDGWKIIQEMTEHELDANRTHELTVFDNPAAIDFQNYMKRIAEEARYIRLQKIKDGSFGGKMRGLYETLASMRADITETDTLSKERLDQLKLFFFTCWNSVYESNEPTTSQEGRQAFWQMARNWIEIDLKGSASLLRRKIENCKNDYGADEWKQFIEDQRRVSAMSNIHNGG